MSQPWGIERLLHPVSVDTLFAQHWESSPLHISRADAGYYSSLMSLKDFDDILATSNPRGGIRVVGGAADTSSKDSHSLENIAATGGLADVYEKFRIGSTVVLPMLHERWAPLRALCAKLAGTLGAGMQANAYLTPPNAQGLNAHYDTHDVFVVQLSGEKVWRLYDSPHTFATMANPYRPDQHRPSGEAQTIHVHAGDLLYVPRGTIHEAASADSTSLHLAVGVLSMPWIDVLQETLSNLAADEPALRQGLPPGFNRTQNAREAALAKGREVIGLLADSLSSEHLVAVADRRAQRAAASGVPWQGRLLDLDQEAAAQLETKFWRRGVEPWNLTQEEERLILEVGTTRLSMPVELEEDLRWLSSAAEPFTPDRLPGQLLPDERLVLTRRLLREGFITTWSGSNQTA